MFSDLNIFLSKPVAVGCIKSRLHTKTNSIYLLTSASNYYYKFIGDIIIGSHNIHLIFMKKLIRIMLIDISVVNGSTS